MVMIKATFLEFGIEPIFPQWLEDLMDMYVMLLLSIGVDQNVIQIYYGEYIEGLVKNIIHHVLNNCQHIHEQKA